MMNIFDNVASSTQDPETLKNLVTGAMKVLTAGATVEGVDKVGLQEKL